MRREEPWYPQSLVKKPLPKADTAISHSKTEVIQV